MRLVTRSEGDASIRTALNVSYLNLMMIGGLGSYSNLTLAVESWAPGWLCLGAVRGIDCAQWRLLLWKVTELSTRKIACITANWGASSA